MYKGKINISFVLEKDGEVLDCIKFDTYCDCIDEKGLENIKKALKTVCIETAEHIYSSQIKNFSI